jgi:membrane protein YqaA with SNARE-associated domain
MHLFKNKIEKIKEFFKKNADKKESMFFLKLISFTESSFFPIPPDPFQIILTLAKPEKWIKFAKTVLLYSILGGIFGYILGIWFFDTFGQRLVDFYSLEDEVLVVGSFFKQNAFWAIFISAISPIPYKVFTISAGLFQVNFFIFVIASIVGRGTRFFLVGYLVHKFGQKSAEKFIKHFNTISLIVGIVIILYLYFAFAH